MFPVSPHDLNIDAEELSHLMTEPTASIRFDGDRNHKFYYLPRFISLIDNSGFSPYANFYWNWIGLRQENWYRFHEFFRNSLHSEIIATCVCTGGNRWNYLHSIIINFKKIEN